MTNTSSTFPSLPLQQYITSDSSLSSQRLCNFLSPHHPSIPHHPHPAHHQPPNATAIAEALHLLRTHPNVSLSVCYSAAPTWTQSYSPAVAAPTAHYTQTPLLQGTHRPRAAAWSSHMSMSGPATAHLPAQLRSRTPSTSTVASAGPASPYAPNNAYPHVANTEYAPHSPLYYPDQAAFYPKSLSSQPTFDGSFTNTSSPFVQAHLAPQNALQAMSAFAINHHANGDFAPDFAHSAQHSMSSHNGSPATPMSGYGGDNMEAKSHDLAQNDFSRQTNPNVQLFRTESQAYQDELYNPPTTTYAPNNKPATRPANTYLSPHRQIMSERLQTANNARSNSPTSAGPQRERSPFRDGSPLAPAGGWRSNGGMTAASLRAQQKEQAEQAEYAQHRPQLQREPTKTISPKEAMLDYTGPEQPSLFQDSIPSGYQRHTGGIERWPNVFVNQAASGFGGLQAPSQPNNFRATPADTYSGPDAYNFVSLPQGFDQSQVTQVPHNSYQTNSVPNQRMNSYVPQTEQNPVPPFPATLTSMESSLSDNAPESSHEHMDNSQAIQRPNDTRANTGTYTCTYHGCTQRFDTPANLQRHKRDAHRSQLHNRNASNASSGAASSGAGSESGRSSASPSLDEDDEGLTSAAIAERNSQAGPHRCTRNNPTTGRPCNTVFSRPYDLTRHEASIHNGRKRQVQCPVCREEKTFSRTDALTRHMRVVHPEAEAAGKRGRRE